MAILRSPVVSALIFCVCIGSSVGAQTVIYADDDPAAVGASIPSTSPLPHDAVVRRWVAVAGESGGGVAGVSADEGADECVAPCTLVYENTLGRSLFGPSSAVGAKLSDDIVTTAVAGCDLDHYVVRVSGDLSGNGPDEPFSVDVALYSVCPGANFDAPPIPNTSCHFEVLGSSAHVYELSCEVPSIFSVPLPQGMFVSVSFNRANAGVVVGAPALRGFSADTLDFPGFACSGWLGGYPSSPHASFYTKLYTRGECSESHIGYRNSKNSGAHFSAGQAELFAEDISLGVPTCNMVAYEVAYRGNGFLQVDLRRFLSNSDPQNGGLISFDTRRNFFSFDPSIKVARAEFAEPIPLPSSFFVTFKTNTTAMGPLRTCKDADIGTTGDFYMVIENNQWEAKRFTSSCWSGFDFTVICEGSAPTGACCDMIFVDESGDSVCRDNLPELNCPFPTRWEENGVCESVCDGGVNDQQPCTRQADCPDGACPGPFPKPCGVSACCKPVEGDCVNVTRPECNALKPILKPRQFQPREYCNEGGQRCPRPGCLMREGECTVVGELHCKGGLRDGEECGVGTIPKDPMDECPGWQCVGGTNNGLDCDPTAGTECPEGSCDPRPGWCMGRAGCDDPACCSIVCAVQPYCCEVYWDRLCADEAFVRCDLTTGNDECFSSSPGDGALLVNVPSMTEGDGVDATTASSDPGFCCHETDPGAQGAGTLWYKFVAPANGECKQGDRDRYSCDPNALDPENPIDGCPGGYCHSMANSVQLSTCCSFSPADDTLLQAFAMSEPDRGLCVDRSVCSVAAQDCVDGSMCALDEETACQNLIPIGCSDDSDTCTCGPGAPTERSELCLTGLTPGETYYVMVGVKDADNQGKYSLRVTSPCKTDPAHPNDLCTDAMPLAGGDVEPLVVPFDLSGSSEYKPATFGCPGEACVPGMDNDIWYDWTAPCSGTATAETCGGSDDTTPFTNLVVYEGCRCPVESGTALDCSFPQPSPCWLGSKVEFEVVKGQCYKIRLGGHMGGEPAGELTIEMRECSPGCEPGLVTFDNPPDGVVDARQPHPPGDPNTRQGINAIDITAPMAADQLGCWAICETADTGTPNAIIGLTSAIDNGDGTVSFTLNLARDITSGAVTTLTHTDDDGFSQTGVFTSHPGNANGDSASAPPDILAIIDYINGVRVSPWGIYSEDIDHSGALDPPDILRVIDLLNHGWLNSELPALGARCP